ncbi:MAG: hypothetical protein GY818_04205 [Planctomycetaceae bacterium]|nr:hypothetical protein [Planctomycetaceae bacterium]
MKVWFLVGIAFFGFSFGGTAIGQESVAQTPAASQSNPSATKSLVPAKSVKSSMMKMGYRVEAWKTLHSSTAEEAEQSIATLEKIGCEVKSQKHGSHIDVLYRCVDWRSMKLSSSQLVDQWSRWCRDRGMETVLLNPLSETKQPTVRFRMLASRTVHLHDEAKAKQIINTLRMIGCEVATNSHGNHLDATFSCPDWLTIELADEPQAHAWQNWLNSSGFETQHTHVKKLLN